MTPGERLLRRLRDEHGLDIPEGATIRRTYAGYWQRSAGAWSWYAVDAEGLEIVPHLGSPERVTDLLKAKALGFHGRFQTEVGSL